jgi:hypothetical protein
MHDSRDVDLSFLYFVKDGKGKAEDEPSPNIALDDGSSLWKSLDLSRCLSNCGEKVFTQPVRSFLIITG